MKGGGSLGFQHSNLVSPDINIDPNGNFIITGTKIIGNNKSIVTVKQNPNGTVIWQKEINTSLNDYGKKSIIDVSGNIYTIGKVQTATGYKTNIIKYSSFGTLIWNYQLNIGASNSPSDILMSSDGFLCFSGEVQTSTTTKVYVCKLALTETLQYQYIFPSGNYQSIGLDESLGKVLLAIKSNTTNADKILYLSSNLNLIWATSITDNLAGAKFDNLGTVLYINPHYSQCD